MRKTFALRISVFIAFLFLACGEATGPDVTVTLTGTTSFGTTGVVSYFILLQNVGEPVLDKDGNGVADLLKLPSTCDPISNISCGYEYDRGTFTLGGLPMTYSYDVYVVFRDVLGNRLFSGRTAAPFVNDGLNATIIVPIQDCDVLTEGDCP